MSHSEELGKLLPALLALQSELKPVPKNDTNPHFGHTFANLEAIHEAVQPLLTKYQLVVTNTMSVLPDGSSGLVTTLWHVSGQWIRGEMPLLLSKEDPQGQGSGITYGRRYAVAALLNLVQADDDGHKATQSRQASRPAPPKQQAAATTPRRASPACPSCGSVESTHKSTRGSGFYCNPKSNGCGRAFEENEGAPDPDVDKETQDELDRIFSG